MTGEEAKRILADKAQWDGDFNCYKCAGNKIRGHDLDCEIGKLAAMLDEQEKALASREAQLLVKEANLLATGLFITGLGYVGELTEVAGTQQRRELSHLRRVEEAARRRSDAMARLRETPYSPGSQGWNFIQAQVFSAEAELAAALDGKQELKEPVYPLDSVPVPEGWRRVDFREPKFDEYFLSESGRIGYQDGGVNFRGRQAEHIIVEKVGGDQEAGNG